MADDFHRKCDAAGIPAPIMPCDAREFKRSGKTTTFRIGGRSVTFGEFRAELAKHGYKPEAFETRLAATRKVERFTTRSAVTVSAGSESPQ